VCYGVLQSVAVCCSVQMSAICCSVLQRVAVLLVKTYLCNKIIAKTQRLIDKAVAQISLQGFGLTVVKRAESGESNKNLSIKVICHTNKSGMSHI